MKKLLRKIILWAFKEDMADFETIKHFCNDTSIQEQITRRRLNKLYEMHNMEPSREMSYDEWLALLRSNNLGFNNPPKYLTFNKPHSINDKTVI